MEAGSKRAANGTSGLETLSHVNHNTSRMEELLCRLSNRHSFLAPLFILKYRWLSRAEALGRWEIFWSRRARRILDGIYRMYRIKKNIFTTETQRTLRAFRCDSANLVWFNSCVYSRSELLRQPQKLLQAAKTRRLKAESITNTTHNRKNENYYKKEGNEGWNCKLFSVNCKRKWTWKGILLRPTKTDYEGLTK
jgi:hypothetical protein